MPSKLEQALELAARGFYLFRLSPNSRTPLAGIEWKLASTTNPKTIAEWFIDPVTGWEQDVNLGVDCGKSGFTVIDVDVKNGKKGKESYDAWQKEFGWPKTFTVKTTSGGLHIYFAEGGFRNTQGDSGGIASGIDTRGEGGYVVAPGSTIDEKPYKITKDVKMVPLPDWLKEKLAKHKFDASQTRDAGKTIIADHPDDIAGAIEFLEQHEPAVQGRGGDTDTYKTFCKLKERGISIDLAIELMEEHWNDRCSPPWDHDDLVLKANSAYKSAQNATGAKSAHAEFEVPVVQVPKKVVTIPKSWNLGLKWRSSTAFPNRDWIIKHFALAKNVTLLIAPPGVGKSTYSLQLALSKITGRNLAGFDIKERGAVAIFNNEDSMEEQERRIVAMAEHFGITHEQCCYPDVTGKGSMLLVNGRDNALLKIAVRNPEGKLVASPAAAQLVAYLLAHGARLCIIDPLSMTHEGSENSNEDMLIVGGIYAEIAARANCAIVLVHHTRKLDQASSEGHSGNLDSARGASSLGGLARVAYTLNVLSTKEGLRLGIAERDVKNYILLEQAKANMSAPGAYRLYFERIGIMIGQTLENQEGEEVGVLRQIALTDKRLENSNAALRQLVGDIESLVMDRTMTIPDIARQLTISFPSQAGKLPRTLEKAIGRLFSEGVLTALYGTLHLDETQGIGSKVTRTIRWEKGAAKLSAADLI